MITCVFCKKKLVTLRGYVTLLHCKVHRNEPRCLFKSVGANCSQTFTTYSAFKGHFYRVHNAPQAAPIAVVADLKCAVSLCAAVFTRLQRMRGLQSDCSDDVIEMILLLLSYFDEKEESMFFHVEDTCLAEEVQLEQVPLTPIVIVCGKSVSYLFFFNCTVYIICHVSAALINITC